MTKRNAKQLNVLVSPQCVKMVRKLSSDTKRAPWGVVETAIEAYFQQYYTPVPTIILPREQKNQPLKTSVESLSVEAIS